MRYVGGGAINWAFAKELRLAGKNDYQEMHEALLQAAADTPGHTVNGIDVPTAESSFADKLHVCWAKMTFFGGSCRTCIIIRTKCHIDIYFLPGSC